MINKNLTISELKKIIYYKVYRDVDKNMKNNENILLTVNKTKQICKYLYNIINYIYIDNIDLLEIDINKIDIKDRHLYDDILNYLSYILFLLGK